VKNDAKILFNAYFNNPGTPSIVVKFTAAIYSFPLYRFWRAVTDTMTPYVEKALLGVRFFKDS